MRGPTDRWLLGRRRVHSRRGVLSDVGRLLVASWVCVAAIVGLAMLLLGGCATLQPIDTTVRRVDSLAGVDIVGDELGVDGWRIVSVTTLDNGGAYVVVLQRKAVQHVAR